MERAHVVKGGGLDLEELTGLDAHGREAPGDFEADDAAQAAPDQDSAQRDGQVDAGAGRELGVPEGAPPISRAWQRTSGPAAPVASARCAKRTAPALSSAASATSASSSAIRAIITGGDAPSSSLAESTFDLAMAADRAAQHGLIQHDPIFRRLRPGEQLLAGQAQRYGPFGEIVGRGGEAGGGDGPGCSPRPAAARARPAVRRRGSGWPILPARQRRRTRTAGRAFHRRIDHTRGWRGTLGPC